MLPIYENLDLIIIFSTLLQKKYLKRSAFPNRDDLQINMKRRSHKYFINEIVFVNVKFALEFWKTI